ncbi:hypothetical protein B5F29_02585 [Lachnoclostridium sp. An196]|uniref:hypothetical protein n=1 Tax=Lachnoclostridium sp. An196 TaxID=1965583 RepID=UPI000B3980A4|nr:hypothetical protein [Lachnoclostridium sp. An196]OUP21386.1 hypothetical protein B5F29_02585 [Lachnoclostridium sp. An196]
MRLIDAEAFIESLGLDVENAREDNIGEIVTLEDFDRQATAFDKEKVIEELMKYSDDPCILHECGVRSEYCSVCMAKKAIEIVEKGGLI